MRWLLLLLPLSLSALLQVTGELVVLKPTATFDSIRPDIRPGGRLKIALLPEMGCSEVWLSTLYVQNRGRRRLPDTSTGSSLRGSLKTVYWTSDLCGSYRVMSSDWSTLSLVGGARYVGLEEIRSVVGAPAVSRCGRSRFSGAGPVLGITSSLFLGPLSLEYSGTSFALIGSRKTRSDIHFAPTIVTLPAMELSLAFALERGPLGARIGYLFNTIWEVSDVPPTSDAIARQLRDASFGGPFFSGRISF